MEEHHVLGDHEAQRDHYDNLGIIVICLGNKKASELTGLMRLLTVLFRDTLPAEEVNTILRDEYSIDLTPDIEKGVAEVCNLSVGLVAHAIEQGERQGYERGLESAKSQSALAMFADSVPVDKIAKYSNLSIQEATNIGKQHGYL